MNTPRKPSAGGPAYGALEYWERYGESGEYIYLGNGYARPVAKNPSISEHSKRALEAIRGPKK